VKAIVCKKYGPPEVLQLKEVAKPAPKANEVCIRIHATAVTSSDCIIRGFNVPMAFWLPMALVIGVTRPRKAILGMVFAGEVDSAGEAVKLFKRSDKVFGFDRFGFGTYAEYKCISEKGMLAAMPTNVKYEEAAAVPFGGLIALAYLRKGGIQSGQKVLIYGASGAVGTSAVQLAKYFEADVTAVCSSANMELVRALGADRVVDYTKDHSLDRGDSHDFTFDAVGKRKSSQLKLSIAQTPKGKYISVDDGSPKFTAEDLVLLRDLVESGKIRAVIDRRYPLEQMAEAHTYVENGHKKGNVIITVG
jgi:NADPH:quinone reductase-like Zn-dependent oxidoreductase